MKLSSIGQVAVVGSMILGIVLSTPMTASAHTEVDYTTPGDGEAIDEPVTEVIVAFTDAVTITGSGFEILDPAGSVIVPEVETTENVVFRLVPLEPLAGGDVGVRFEVAAADGHVVTGAFSFTVASVPTTVTATTTSSTTAETATTAGGATTPDTSIPATSTVAPGGVTEVPEEGGSAWILVAVGVAALFGAGGWIVARNRNSD